MITRRQKIEIAVDYLIEFLDESDGDPDLEAEPLEEQHDAEADLAWSGDRVPPFYIIAERARRKVKH